MRSPKKEELKKGNSYDLSISDLMAALCCIFILFLIFVIHRLNEERKEFEIKNGVATEFRLKQKDLYDAIYKEFRDDLVNWEAEIELEKGNILVKFTKDSMMFEPEKAKLKEGFMVVLDDFFPRLVKILEDPKYKGDIQEIRIEGHTAVNLRQTRKEDYESGMKLSQERTREVLYYCLETIPETRDELQKNIIAIGYSNSIPAADDTKTRRVEFSIRTRAENVIESIEKSAKK